MTRLDPEPKRCGTCDVRLSRVGPDHEDACFRAATGWPPFEEDHQPDPHLCERINPTKEAMR